MGGSHSGERDAIQEEHAHFQVSLSLDSAFEASPKKSLLHCAAAKFGKSKTRSFTEVAGALVTGASTQAPPSAGVLICTSPFPSRPERSHEAGTKTVRTTFVPSSWQA